MAVAYRTSAVDGNIVSATSPAVTITPATNDLFLIFCQAVGNTNTSPTCSDGNTGGTYTLVFTAGSLLSANTLSCFVRNALVPNTASTTVTVACGAHAAAEVCVVALSGAPAAGTAAVIQYAVQANQASSTTPAPTLSNAIIFGDIVLSSVGNATDPAGVSVSANTPIYTFTLAQNAGQTACGLGVEYTAGIFGTPATGAITWGSTSASAFASCALEIGAPAPETGVNISKLVGYAAAVPPVGVDISKLVGYAAAVPPAGVDISKLVAYGVLISLNTNPPVWPVVNPPNGYVGNPYAYSWDLSPAAEPTTYSIVSGSLPPGLSLSSPGGPSGDVGEIGGTPTTTGTYGFTVLATNTYGTAPQAMSITISVPAGANYGFVG